MKERPFFLVSALFLDVNMYHVSRRDHISLNSSANGQRTTRTSVFKSGSMVQLPFQLRFLRPTWKVSNHDKGGCLSHPTLDDAFVFFQKRPFFFSLCRQFVSGLSRVTSLKSARRAAHSVTKAGGLWLQLPGEQLFGTLA